MWFSFPRFNKVIHSGTLPYCYLVIIWLPCYHSYFFVPTKCPYWYIFFQWPQSEILTWIIRINMVTKTKITFIIDQTKQIIEQDSFYTKCLISRFLLTIKTCLEVQYCNILANPEIWPYPYLWRQIFMAWIMANALS